MSAAAGAAAAAGAPQPGAAQPKLVVRDLTLSYRTGAGRHRALTDVDLTLADGEFLALVGPSGCGKSTLLKIAAGLLKHTSGQILVDGQELRGQVPERVGMVFQNDAILPWRTVVQNVEYPLGVHGMSADERRRRAGELLETVGLARFADYYPRQLSGGMRKRVALARTMAYDPELYLMDEPFGPLDAQTRIRIGAEFLRIWEHVGKSVIFVTHDVEEAITLADRVAVMTAGPGRIKCEFTVPFGRPRDFHQIRFEPAFRDLYTAIWDALSNEQPADR